jgi:hypothetical protein
MRNAQKPDHQSLRTIIGWLKEGRFVVPDFQREFEWKPWAVRDLMRSIFLDYYIGSLLLWKGTRPNIEALSCEPVYGRGEDGHPEYIVLDGQQRLTAIHYACVGPDVPLRGRKNRTFLFIRVDKLMANEHDEAFGYDWTRWATRLQSDRDEQFRNHWFPLTLMGSDGFELPNWLQAYEAWWKQMAQSAADAGDEQEAEECSRKAQDANEFGKIVLATMEEYQITFVELDRELELDRVCDIFTQINSTGLDLNTFDLINAMLRPKGLQLKDMFRKVEQRFIFMDSSKANIYLLQIMSILKQAYCSPKYLYYLVPGSQKKVRNPDRTLRTEVLVEDSEQFQEMWNTSVDALADTLAQISHPQEFGVTSAAYLPYQSILPVLAALQYRASALEPGRRSDATRKIRHWYWASVFTNRYSGSVESRAAQDFLAVTAWFESDENEPSVIGEAERYLQTVDLTGLRKKGDAVYNGVFNLLVINGARDWATGMIARPDDIDDHHIIPQSWGRPIEAIGGAIDTILNRTPLSAETNRRYINDRLPNEYLPEWIERDTEVEVRRILRTHLISDYAFDVLLRRPFAPDDFKEFIAERQRSVLDALQRVIGNVLDLSPPIRIINEAIEEIELGLRKTIAETLEQDPGRVPPHLIQQFEERLSDSGVSERPASDNPGRLTELLAFSDLRQLEEIVMHRSLWAEFQPRFSSKEDLRVKFSQLANLRNAIRHSRPIDPAGRLDGEAAIAWFNARLGALTP